MDDFDLDDLLEGSADGVDIDGNPISPRKVEIVDLRQSDEDEEIDDNDDVTEFLREPRIDAMVSVISPHKQIRNYANKIQRDAATLGNLVAEGRDIGSTVLPDANFKFFITATPEARAERRYNQYKNQGNAGICAKLILEQIKQRDENDKNRKHGKMCAAADAITVDTTNLNLNQVIMGIETYIYQKLEQENTPAQ